ncbi:MAG: DUF3078 domain-containing protein [Alphaproteobacteria bacterium]|nr:DUF3078 domain-containing protein [Alphaproteobacteria bacterium]
MHKLLPAVILLAALPVLAEETDPKWTFDVKELSLSYSNTTVGNSREYKDSPVSAYSADSQYNIVGKLDAFLNRSSDASLWQNNLMLNYGKLKIKPAGEEAESSESADKIWLSTDYNRKVWQYWDTDIGPFVQAAFQTEFTANQDSPRYKVLSAREGLKMFEGKYIKELYGALVEEYDFTYSHNKNTKFAWEVGLKAEYPIREGVKLTGTARYTDYFHYSKYVPTDLRYDLDLTAKMEVSLTDTLAFAPYVSYRRGQARGTDKVGSNFMVGLQLKYADLFNLN